MRVSQKRAASHVTARPGGRGKAVASRCTISTV
jgi:hypothetical protein